MSADYNQPGPARGVFESSRRGIWAEIAYLDSETNYRECLPDSDTATKGAGELILMDDADTSIWNTVMAAFLVMFVALLFVVLLARLFDL